MTCTVTPATLDSQHHQLINLYLKSPRQVCPLQIPIQRLKPGRPSQAQPVPTGQQGTDGQQMSSPQPKKRRQQAIAGGTTALAALFCFLIFCGPELPGLSGPSGSSSLSFATPHTYNMLPASDNRIAQKGRVLQAAVSSGETIFAAFSRKRSCTVQG